MKVSAVGIPWYTRANYKRILEVMEDRHLLSPTFDKWLHRAEKTLESLKRQGIVAHRVEIDPESFPAWCRAHGLNVDANARMEFASSHAALIERDKH